MAANYLALGGGGEITLHSNGLQPILLDLYQCIAIFGYNHTMPTAYFSVMAIPCCHPVLYKFPLNTCEATPHTFSPAKKPVENAICRLNPPVYASTSITSPAK